MPRKTSKNDLCARSRLTREQFERVLSAWCFNVPPEIVVETLNKGYSGSGNVIGKDAVIDYFNDFGDFHWVVFGYSACCYALASINELDIPYKYPHLDPYIKDIIKAVHGLLHKKSVGTIKNYQQIMKALRLIFHSDKGKEHSSAAIYLDLIFAKSNGFRESRTHVHLSRAIFLQVTLDNYYPGMNPTINEELLRFSSGLLFEEMVTALEKYKLRYPLPQSSFPWCEDGWMRSFKS